MGKKIKVNGATRGKQGSDIIYNHVRHGQYLEFIRFAYLNQKQKVALEAHQLRGDGFS